MRSNIQASTLTLAGLKDFQKRTVEYVFRRFHDDDPAQRFLVADEVGLGKTLVARGIIAKTLEKHLQGKGRRLDVIYVCSNAAIAAQNIKRLNICDGYAFSLATRLTYLPREIHKLREKRVNFISLTPGTAFDHGKSRGGNRRERAILHRLLYDLLAGESKGRARLRKGLFNLLRATVNEERWRDSTDKQRSCDLDAKLSKAFHKAMRRDGELYALLREGCERFARYGNKTKIPQPDNNFRYALIQKLRKKLASTCISALKPKLIILDEFQRFKDLLDGDDDGALLLKALFGSADTRVLLLSATPYKMFTLDMENDTDDHYPDFIRTLEFLYDNAQQVSAVKNLLSEHGKLLKAQTGELECLHGTKRELERELLKVMCRTERIAITHNHNSMVRDCEKLALLVPGDLEQFSKTDAVAREIHAEDTIEYWKSAPYLVNFLKNYEFRRKLDARLVSPSEDLHTALSAMRKQMLARKNFRSYKAVDIANPKMRALFEDTLDQGMWQLLWMPPSMPYVKPGGAYKGKDNLTKALVFSSWNAVPDAIASICSYEAERKMLAGSSVRYDELYDKVRPLLRFAISAKDKRLTGMPVMAWLLPSPSLATRIDPLGIALRHPDGLMDAKTLRNEVKSVCHKLLRGLPKGSKGRRADERWYWAAPVLLDAENGVLEWCKNPEGWKSLIPDQDATSRFKDHLALLVEMAEGKIALGPRPDDLEDVLCDFALAGPGVCALRSLGRLYADTAMNSRDILNAAARIAAGFRSLFNMPETIAMLRGSGEDSYWRLTLRYCIDGNLQSVLDEYVHVLRDSLHQQNLSPKEQFDKIAEHLNAVLSLRTAQLRIDEIRSLKNALSLTGFNTRCRFALRFGDIRDDNNQTLTRAETVRDAFNSPFRPFILASTSIGQEGLDFHIWCHAIVHWNLPPNPVDLEQREGRVHRYKGHAIRKNIAERFGLVALSKAGLQGDPWQELFRIAADACGSGHSDLIPYWIFEEGSARIERRIPLLPCSKDIGRLRKLKQGLALYRMVFGQPRQEDLMERLLQNGIDADSPLQNWLLSLVPPDLEKPCSSATVHACTALARKGNRR